MPEARGEVASAVMREQIVVVGGFLADGASSRRVDAFSPATGRWRRLRDLPVALNHAMATAARGRLYVFGSYGTTGAQRGAFVLARGRWRRLASLPEPRAAGGAVAVGRKLYVVGGVGGTTGARDGFAFDVNRGRWSRVPGPTAREHLGVTVLRGRIYAVAGRGGAVGGNTTLVESWRPGERRWRRAAPVPEPRGGTGAAAVGGEIVSVGGEAASGTIASVFAYRAASNTWRRLPDLPTPRHGLAVAGFRGRLYAIAGGTVPGLSVSGKNEVLTLTPPSRALR
jgi:N-acetylneuraminic acid mutarotase